MAGQADFLVNFRARYDEVVQATNAIIAQFRILATEMEKAGRFGDSKRFGIEADRMAKEAGDAAREIVKLTEKIVRLEQVEADIARRRAKSTFLTKLDPTALEALGLQAGGANLGQRLGVDKISAKRLELEQQRAKIAAGLNAANLLGEKQVQDVLAQIPGLYDKINAAATERQHIAQRTARILSGELENNVVSERLRELASAEDAVQQNIAALERSTLAQLGGRAGGKIAEERRKQEDRLTEAMRQRESLTKEISQIEQTLARLTDSDYKSRISLEARLDRLLRDRAAAIAREADARERLRQPTSELASALELGGVAPLHSQLKQQAEDLRRQQLEVSSQRLDAVSPSLKNLIAEYTSVNNQLRLVIPNTEKHNELLRESTRLQLEIEAEARRAPARGIDQPLDPETFRQRQLAALPGLERAFIGAFDDMGRRFQATLQFAISGALIFGLQQGIRRFIETAIEVQRAFADIATAFEFDINFERGSREFNIQLESIRGRILAVADEFNVLPTEANKAAFQMVSRFGDARDALTALRAQLLATKISTIDQGEALRALSAVAENFAAANLQVNDGLSISEKLFARERAAVLNYGKALDIAALLQQRFGVDTEDTLEGVSRLAPTFSQLGFSMEQTSSIVAAVARELGQTGANAAERLNRSIGQLTEPSIRNALLDLAATSDALTLTFEDFTTGERALRALVSQFRNLEQVDPATAFQLLNVLGQRRELEVVAALFNTTELQQAMEEALTGAAGAAEQRFSFLEQTISERFKSLAGGFERLAQNVQELGLLTPFQALVAVLDEILIRVNQFLEGVNTLITELGVAGTLLKGVFAVGAASAAVGRIAALVTRIATFGGKVATNAATVAGSAGVAAVQSSALAMAAVFDDVKKQMVNNRLGLIGLGKALFQAAGAAIIFARTAIAASLRPAISAIGTALFFLGGKIPIVAKGLLLLNNAAISMGTGILGLGSAIIGIVGLLVLGITNAISAFKKSEEAARDFEQGLIQANTEARRQRSANPENFQDPIDFEVAENLALLQSIRMEGEEKVMSELQEFFTVIYKIPPNALRSQESLKDRVIREFTEDTGGFLLDMFKQSFGSRALFERLRGTQTTGSPGFFDEQEFLAEKQALGSQVQQLLADLVVAAAKAPRRPKFGAGLERRGAELQQELLEGAQQIADAPDAEALTEARANWEKLVQDYQEYLQQLGLGVAQLEDSVKGSQDRIDEAQRSFSLGRISGTDFERVLEAEIRQLRAGAAALQVSPGVRRFLPDQEELVNERLKAADEAEMTLLQARIARIESQRNRTQLILNETSRLRAELTFAAQKLATLQGSGDENAIAEAELEIILLQREIAQSLRDRAKTLAEGRVEAARTNAEWFQAQQELIGELEKEVTRVSRPDGPKGQEEVDPVARQTAQLEQQAAEIELADRRLDVAQRTIIAVSRLSGPINNRMNQLSGQIKAVQLALAEPGQDPLDVLELTVELRELMAQRMQEEVARMTAFARVQAGVNNEIKSLQAQIVGVTAEVQVSAQIFGEMSTEFLEARQRLAELKSQLANTLLSLDDINRRLGTDLSNDFEQAILDLQLVAEKLQAPDLGGLEEAQLLLEKQRGEMQAERAFFSTELFNLRFLTETGQLGQGAYLNALRGLLSQVDTTTQQGKEIFLEIQGLIDGLTEDVSDLAFNVPTAIRLPTIFEVRRALAADQLGVNYMDNRQMDIIVNVRDATDVEALVASLGNALGTGGITSTAGRFAPGASSLTLGGF